MDQLWAYRGMEEVSRQVGEPSAQLDESSLTEDPTEASPPPGIPVSQNVPPDSQPTAVVPGEEEGVQSSSHTPVFSENLPVTRESATPRNLQASPVLRGEEMWCI